MLLSQIDEMVALAEPLRHATRRHAALARKLRRASTCAACARTAAR
jgi:hypothetical protein